MRKLSQKDKEILAKLAPELGGATGPAPGHDFKFLLVPVSHRVSESSEDFANRLERLSDEELEYIADIIISGEEDVHALAEGDFEALLEVMERRLPNKAKLLAHRNSSMR